MGLTNTALLEETIKNKGIKNSFLAGKLGISNQGFLNKLHGKTEFKTSEMSILANTLSLGQTEFFAIFFNVGVDKTSTG